MPGTIDSPLICIHNVEFSYGPIKVLENIDFDIKRGEYLGILGPNGSGKTTLLKILLGLLPPQKGEVHLFQQNISHFKDWSKIGFVPQKATQIEAKFPVTVREIVGLTAKNESEVLSSLKKVGLEDLKDRLITELSGGQQQRVFIAKALAGKPELLILDEPAVGIDPGSQTEFYALLSKLNKEMGLTLIIVSHDTDVIIQEVSRIICINKRMVCHVTPKEFVSGNYIDTLYGDERKHITHNHQRA